MLVPSKTMKVILKISNPNALKHLSQFPKTFCSIIDHEPNSVSEDTIDDKRNVSRLPERSYMHYVKKEFSPTCKNDRFFYLKTNLKQYYGTFGSSSNINPGILWYTKQELQDKLEKEKITSLSLETMVKNVQIENKQIQDARIARIKEVETKHKQLDTWKKELFAKIAAKRSEAEEKQAMRDKLITEVREFVGFSIDPKDSRFKKALEQKEKEQKRAMKAELKKKKEEQSKVKAMEI